MHFAARWLVLLLFLTTALASALDSSQGVAAGPGTPSGPQAGGVGALASLDFVHLGAGHSRVVLGAAVAPMIEERDGALNVDLPGLEVGPALSRPLDTSGFDSPVRWVRAGPGPDGARVVVQLRADARWRLYRDEASGLWVVDVDEGRGGEVNVDVQPPDDALQAILITSDGRVYRAGDYFSTGTSLSAAPRISIEFQEEDIRRVVADFAEFSGVNMILADGVSGRVTARLLNAPWDEALLAILSAQGLTARPFGDNLVVIEPL